MENFIAKHQDKIKGILSCFDRVIFKGNLPISLMHVRIQTWFPFTIQVYVNGHSWLARKMDRHHLGYEKLDRRR